MSDRLLHVAIAGGGVAAAEAALALRDLAGDRVRLTLVAPEPQFELRALRTTEPFGVGHVLRRSMAGLAARVEAELLATSLREVDAERHTVLLADDRQLAYDALVIAVGARARPAFRHVLTFGAGPGSRVLGGLLSDLEHGRQRSVVFLVPPHVTWTLPLYELALMTARHAAGAGLEDVRLEIVSPEEVPVALFGPEGSHAVRALLDEAHIDFRGNAFASVDRPGHLTISPDGEGVEVDRIVALPELYGPYLEGVPGDARGFIRVDDAGAVPGVPDVHAAGDATTFPIKQGGIACQQADAIAARLAAAAGASVPAERFRPVLRGTLVTGDGAEYLRHAVYGGAGDGSSTHAALWFSAAKVAGHHLSRWLATPAPASALGR